MKDFYFSATMECLFAVCIITFGALRSSADAIIYIPGQEFYSILLMFLAVGSMCVIHYRIIDAIQELKTLDFRQDR